MSRITALTTFLAAASIAAAEVPCYDYSSLKLELTSCTAIHVRNQIKLEYDKLNTRTCRGGFARELRALTGALSDEAAWQTLQDLCDSALADATDEARAAPETWEYLEQEPHRIHLEEYFEGYSNLNEETGNFRQDASEFEKHGGDEKFFYIGDDPRFNDHYRTTEESYLGGQAVHEFYKKESRKTFLSAPTPGFERGCRSNTAVCCWHRDRQYLDRNGNCAFQDCANQNPGDNTDLCWTTEDNGTVFPYPGDATENDLHCHGFAWGTESDDSINTHARWNNLFFVSLYDHMYQRGYVESITSDPLIRGDQAMCGCVEEMAPIARADCTEAIAELTYEATVDASTNLLVVEHVPGTLELVFRACRGYEYVPGFGPDDYEADNAGADGELVGSNNDLAAFVFRQYLERKMEDAHVELVEETLVGYRNPEVNKSDEERERVCAEAFADRFPDLEYVERKVTDEEE